MIFDFLIYLNKILGTKYVKNKIKYFIQSIKHIRALLIFNMAFCNIKIFTDLYH